MRPIQKVITFGFATAALAAASMPALTSAPYIGGGGGLAGDYARAREVSAADPLAFLRIAHAAEADTPDSHRR